jgi:hypothetical protein
VYAIGSGNNGNTHKGHVWAPPNNCKETFEVSANAGAAVNDIEDPASVNFSSGARLIRGPNAVKNIQISYRYYVIRGATSTDIQANSGAVNLSHAGVSYPLNNVDLTSYNLKAGDQVCAYVEASPALGEANQVGDIISVDNSKPKATDQSCETIVDRPYLSVYGGDVKVGGAFLGGDCQQAAGIRAFTKAGAAGSGVQFAALALGDITGFNSARLRSTAPQAPTGLTFANQGVSGQLGGANCVPDYFADADGLSPSTANSINLASLSSGNYLYHPSTTLTLQGSLSGSSRVNLFIEGDVRLVGATNFATVSWNNVDQIPALNVYVKGNIYIQANVDEVTGVYTAQPSGATGGTIVTCVQPGTNTIPGTAQLSASCGRQLHINGAFVAQKVRFMRAVHSLRDAKAGEATPQGSQGAEIFSLSPDLYIAAPPLAPGGATKGKYDSFTGLPPIL